VHSEILSVCKTCCSAESHFFKYIGRVDGGIPYTCAISLVLLHFCPLV
jgi:hypothetical protein